MNHELFDDDAGQAEQDLAPGARLLRGHALAEVPALLVAVAAVQAQAPLRQMRTPGGLTMGVAMSNCGALGWISDARGYRYQAADPLSGLPWPAMPHCFAALAARAAARAGFAGFRPDAALINRCAPGTRLSLHQDRDEHDHGHPIVSISLGLPAVFLFGGLTRGEPALRVPLRHGDVLVWGGPARLRFHGVLPLAPGEHPRLGAQRINITLRRAG